MVAESALQDGPRRTNVSILRPVAQGPCPGGRGALQSTQITLLFPLLLLTLPN